MLFNLELPLAHGTLNLGSSDASSEHSFDLPDFGFNTMEPTVFCRGGVPHWLFSQRTEVFLCVLLHFELEFQNALELKKLYLSSGLEFAQVGDFVFEIVDASNDIAWEVVFF